MTNITQTIGEELARQYLRLLRAYPVATSILTILVACAVGLVIWDSEKQRRADEQRRRESLASYTQQLEQLDRVQRGLKDLSEFVLQQRAKLQESEELISKLQEEKQRIEPLVQADRKVVEAVFQLQKQRAAALTSRERWIGFGLGVAASLLASILYSAVLFAWQRSKRTEAQENDPSPNRATEAEHSLPLDAHKNARQ
jgi:hypothetical protein